jgi:hypothetical protein
LPLIGSGERLILVSRNYAIPFLRLFHVARPNRKRNATAHRVDISRDFVSQHGGDSTMIAKPRTVAVAAALAAVIVGSASIPAVAETPGYDSCYTLSIERGSGPNMGGGNKEHAQHKAFMDQCLAGKIAATPQANSSTVKLPADAHASTVAFKRISRHSASARVPTEARAGGAR